MRLLIASLLGATLLAPPLAAQPPPYRTLDDRLQPREPGSLEAWRRRAAYLREHVLWSSGLLPLPEKTPLEPHVFDEQKRGDYSVSKVYFESLPGFFVTGNLYQPSGAGPFPAILSPHGHWTYGRLENSELASVPGRAINLARQGFVVFSYDMIGYDDSRQLEHRLFDSKRARLWGLHMAGLQLWNGIRALDFLESLPQVDRGRIGMTGASGGGTQTFLLAAADERVKVAAPVNMISLHMQGGCLCENPPGLRLDTDNVELSATIAPRPLLMVSATGDWTRDTLRLEFPAMQKYFALVGAPERLQAVQFDFPHNYNRQSREAVYAWMARWLKGAPADVKVEEKPFTPEPLPQLLVFHGRALPEHAVTPEQLTEQWIAAAQRQLETADPAVLRAALLHSLALQPRDAPPRRTGKRVVVLASADAALAQELKRAGLSVRPVRFTPFDAEAAAKVSMFETYNRTPASQRVADIANALRDVPRAILIADGDAALPALLAQAAFPAERVIVDVGGFDPESDAAFLERLYLPGLRRAGDLHTALRGASDVTVHGAGPSFRVAGPRVESRKLTAAELVALARGR
jgi:X-Pro dipeptidyl-peptidase-like protein